MYRVLGLSDDEKARIERARKGKGIGGRLYGLTSYLNPFDASGAGSGAGGGGVGELSVSGDSSLADLWVDFLLKETEQQQSAREQQAVAAAEKAATQAHGSASSMDAAGAASIRENGSEMAQHGSGGASGLGVVVPPAADASVFTAAPVTAPVQSEQPFAATATSSSSATSTSSSPSVA